MAIGDKGILEKITIVLLIAALLVIGFNAFQIGQLKGKNNANTPITAQAVAENNPVNSEVVDLNIIPKGMPNLYGNEMGVSFDDVSSSNQAKADAAINKLGILDQQITLNGKDKERYIAVAGKISCEYCCGVESIIFSNGNAACGCAHSFAMRGLAKYLIKNHGSEYTDDKILEELGKWKTLFFPSKIAAKAKILKDKGIELSYINLASNKYRGIENPN